MLIKKGKFYNITIYNFFLMSRLYKLGWQHLQVVYSRSDLDNFVVVIPVLLSLAGSSSEQVLSLLASAVNGYEKNK